MKPGWRLANLGDVCDFQNGFAFQSSSFTKVGEPIIRISDIQNNEVIESNVVYFNPSSYKEDLSRYIVYPNDILIAMSGGTTGKIGLNNTGKCFYLNQRVGVFRENKSILNHRYLYYYLHTKSEESLRISTGAAQPNLSTAQIKAFVIPIPPLPEQQRIVDVLDQEFLKIDALAANTEKSFQATKDFLQSLFLKGLHGDLFYSGGDGIGLANSIRKKKRELEAKRLIPKKPELNPVSQEDSVPFAIPKGWCWCKLAEVSLIQEGAGIRKFQYKDRGIQLLTVSNIIDKETSYIDIDKQKIFVSEDEYKQKYQQLTLKYGDIVCACSGGSWGKTAVFDLDETMMLNTSTLRLRFFGDMGDNRYLYFLTKSDFFKKQIEVQMTGMQPNFGYAHYSKVLIPIPSLEEQSKIASIWEDVMERCSVIQNNYQKTLTLCDDLKQALLRKAFNGEL